MAKKKEQPPREGVWMMTLDRFGYDIVVVGRTKEEAELAMREEYIKTYAKYNDLDEGAIRARLNAESIGDDIEDADDPYNPYNEFVEYYNSAFEDAEPRFYEYGKVEWE